MKKMLTNALQSALKKALYGLAGSAAAWLATLKTFPGVPEDLYAKLVWMYAVIPAGVAAAAFLARVATYDPAKVRR